MDVSFVRAVNTVTVPPRRTTVLTNNTNGTAFTITIDVSASGVVGDGKIFIHNDIQDLELDFVITLWVMFILSTWRGNSLLYFR